MQKAEVMISAFAAAGFTQAAPRLLHGLPGRARGAEGRRDRFPRRAPGRCGRIRSAGGDITKPVYVIGTEVPIPGGAMHALDELELTTPEDALRTVQSSRNSLCAGGTVGRLHPSDCRRRSAGRGVRQP